MVSARQLLDRLRHTRSRAADLAEVRRRFALVRRDGRRAGAAEVDAALHLRALREQLATALGALSACACCSRGYSWPEGAWDGGQCCSSNTEDSFRDHEVAALALGGTRARHLRAPRAAHAGCAFRGPEGCTLVAADRPTVCVRYLCKEVRRELFARGDLTRVEALVADLEETYGHFLELRNARLEREEWIQLGIP